MLSLRGVYDEAIQKRQDYHGVLDCFATLAMTKNTLSMTCSCTCNVLIAPESNFKDTNSKGADSKGANSKGADSKGAGGKEADSKAGRSFEQPALLFYLCSFLRRGEALVVASH